MRRHPWVAPGWESGHPDSRRSGHRLGRCLVPRYAQKPVDGSNVAEAQWKLILLTPWQLRRIVAVRRHTSPPVERR